MSAKEIWNRGNNLLSVAIVALSGFAFLPEFFLESEWQFKIDEGLLFCLGIGALTWYLRGKHKFQHSLIPIVMVWGAFVIKIAAVFIEIKEKDDVGDDFGAITLFLLASILVTYLYIKAKKMVFA